MRVTILVLAIALIAGVSTASAAIAVGTPFSGESWGQRWEENVGVFDTFAWRITGGPGDFEFPGLRNFGSGPADWSLFEQTSDDLMVVGHGTATAYLQWLIMYLRT